MIRPARSKAILLAYIGLILTNLFWAGNAVAARALIRDIGPCALSFWRWAIALALLLPWAWPHLRGRGAEIRAHGPRIAWLGALSVGGYNTLLYLAAHTTTAVNITLVSATIPIAVALFAWWLLHEAIDAHQWLGVAAALVGVLTIIGKGNGQVFAQMSYQPGDLLMVAAVTIWGLYSVLLRRHPLPFHPLAQMTLFTICGLAFILPLFIWESLTGGAFWPARHIWPTLGYVGIFPSILAYMLWNHSIAKLGPTRTAIFIYLMPLFTALLAYLLLGEALQWFHAAGGLLILAGLYFASRPKAQSKPRLAAEATS